MKIAAICNQQPEVGKTTLALNLAQALAMDGQRVLLVDMDPSSALARALGIFKSPKLGLDQVLLEGESLIQNVVATRELLDFLPSGENLDQVEFLEGGVERGQFLKSAVEHTVEDYDWVILDCASQPGLLLVNAIIAAEMIILPVLPDEEVLLQTYAFNSIIDKFATLRQKPLLKRKLNLRQMIKRQKKPGLTLRKKKKQKQILKKRKGLRQLLKRKQSLKLNLLKKMSSLLRRRRRLLKFIKPIEDNNF